MPLVQVSYVNVVVPMPSSVWSGVDKPVLARIRQRFLEAYDAFADAYKAASLRLRQHKDATRLHIQQQYPLGSLVRPRWYIPAPADFVHPWRHGVDDADLALA